MASILIIGATGYIGGWIVPKLIDEGHSVRVLVRDPQKVQTRGWKSVEVYKGDLLQPETLPPAFKDIDIVYYLAHSMSAGRKAFMKHDQSAAWYVMTLCRLYDVKRIIYLGGLGKRTVDQSPHLRSRHEVGDILRSGPVPVTEFRAAVIIGAGSYSFEIIHHLVNRLPVMICPKWIYVKTQPIAISDVLQYLIECIDKPQTAGKIYDIGGRDILSYRDMILTISRVLGLQRYLIPVPVLTPKLSSYWLNFVTPVPTKIARVLVESMRQETVCENNEAHKDFTVKPIGFEESVKLAFYIGNSPSNDTVYTDDTTVKFLKSVDHSHLFINKQVVKVDASADEVFSVFTSLGGNRGWLYGNSLWKIRGYIDTLFGGVGLRRGRSHPAKLTTGDVVDCWRVEEYIPPKRFVLRTEMKVRGSGWLEFETESINESQSILKQTAYYYPQGLAGLLYWYSVYPIHILIFGGMARAIGKYAEEHHKENEYIPA